ncbi:PqqD family protein [Streptomyces sp. MMS24-I2-30]|uniref:PqqD family protein n=1 Tax=Streptomyces sp. MMS24-I2-30 TaxID=3351564 RepID=UPI003896AE2B
MWHLYDGVHCVLTDEGGAILNERTGRWSCLTPTATAAVMLLLASASEEEAAGRFAERYSIPAGQAVTDMHAVASALAAQGLAHDAPVPLGRIRQWWKGRPS